VRQAGQDVPEARDRNGQALQGAADLANLAGIPCRQEEAALSQS
jgi:hypothetical protein